MPIYEYMCTNDACGHELEALQKISDERLVYCPSCGEPSLKKKISAAGFRLKGTGWYETDFKNSGKKKAADKDAKSDSGATDTAKSDGGSKAPDGGSKASGGGKSEGGAKASGGGSTEAA